VRPVWASPNRERHDAKDFRSPREQLCRFVEANLKQGGIETDVHCAAMSIAQHPRSAFESPVNRDATGAHSRLRCSAMDRLPENMPAARQISLHLMPKSLYLLCFLPFFCLYYVD
jgi:hypothetical protein